MPTRTLVLLMALLTPLATAETSRPEFLLGTVNGNAQLIDGAAWAGARDDIDGMLLHVHCFVRGLDTPGNRKITDLPLIIQGLAPQLAKKHNLLELTFHLRSAKDDPAAIGRDHAKTVAQLEAQGIPVAAINVDWILGIMDIAAATVPAEAPNRRDAILAKMMDLSRRYVEAFRAAGRQEPLHAVFPPIYLDEGRWINARRQPRHGLQASDIIAGLLRVGFAGYTADSPAELLANPTYRAQGYLEALASIAATCHAHGGTFGFIINGNNGEKDPAAYDQGFAKASQQALATLKAHGLRPDRIIYESWYRGPYRLVPDTDPTTFTGSARLLAKEFRAW